MSMVDFSVEDGNIRYGLAGIKNVGESLAREIVRERQLRGEYLSVESFAFRIGKGLTKKALESLIQCGAFDEIGARHANLSKVEAALSQRGNQPDLQMSLFGEEGPGFDVRQAQIADFFRVKLVERFVDDGLRSDAVAG